MDGHHPRDVAAFLGQRGIHVWDGDYYAFELMRTLDLADHGGMVRVGLVHYNESAEVERLGRALEELVAA
jgi:selenocysteine lyase/cysteine desulfurase